MLMAADPIIIYRIKIYDLSVKINDCYSKKETYIFPET